MEVPNHIYKYIPMLTAFHHAHVHAHTLTVTPHTHACVHVHTHKRCIDTLPHQLNDMRHVNYHPGKKQTVTGREIFNKSNKCLHFFMFIFNG